MASSSSSPEISSAEPTNSFSYKDATKDEVLEDLSSRFILNLPDHELASLERVCFQVEQAHWFYEDFVREQNNKLPSLPLKKFSEMLFHACPLLNQWSGSHEQTFNDFMQYKTRVPVCGAIMLNDAMDKCVLVKGWKASSGWGFPKGKINETEPPPTCAIREVLEETGYNLQGQLDPQDVIELSIKEQKISLYIVPGISEDFPFKTKTRKEISKIEWFKLSELPTWKRNKNPPGRFYLISPFIAGLKAYIKQRKPRNQRKLAKQKKAQSATTTQQQINDFHDLKEQLSSQPVAEIGERQTTSSTQPDIATQKSANSIMDPHMTRLLSSLTMSASSVDSISQDFSKCADNETVRGRPSPPPRSDTSGDSPVVSHATEQHDWSSSVPPNFIQPLSVSHSNDHQIRSDPSGSLATSLPSVAHSVTNGSGKHADKRIPSPIRTKPPFSPPIGASVALSSVVPSVPPPTTASTVSPTSPTSRKSSSTADISPYLARATAVPTSAKRLQQLSLLESVASESEKLAPIIAARAAMVSRGPIAGPYPPPSSIAPPAMQVPHRENGVLYSSVYPIPPSSAAGFHPRQDMDNFGTGFHDPFQVRSRTSQAFHRPSLHNPTGSVNINQNHILASINSARGGPANPGYPMNHHFIHEQMPVPILNGGAQFYPPQVIPQFGSPDPGVNALPNFLQPSLTLPSAFRSYQAVHAVPTANAALNMSLAPSQNNPSVSLLSLLNGRPSQPSVQTHIRP